MLVKPKIGVALVSILLVLVVLPSLLTFGTAQAATTITAYQSQIPVNVHSPYQASQWTDTPTINEPTSGMTFAVKQNGSGWLFLMIWKQSSVCMDQYCFGGIELGYMNNTQAMGSASTPTIMILTSTSFTNNVDEFISTAETTPTPVESFGYTTQSVCGLTSASGQYTVECYRPFKLHNASPYDFALGVGSTIEIGFAVGEMSNPGEHAATQMTTYVLTFSGQTYGSSSTSSTSSSTTTTSTTTSTTTTTPTTTSTTTTPTTSTTTTTTTPTTSTTTTTPSTSSTTIVTTTTPSKSPITFTSPSSGATVVGPQSLAISGTISPAPSPPGNVFIEVKLQGSSTMLDITTQPVAASGAFSYGAPVGGSVLWVTGTYVITVTDSSGSTGTTTFMYVASSTTVTTSTSQTGTATTSTSSTSSSQTSTQTVTTTTTSISVPDWAYGLMIVLLIAGLAIGYLVRGPISRRPAVQITE